MTWTPDPAWNEYLAEHPPAQSTFPIFCADEETRKHWVPVPMAAAVVSDLNKGDSGILTPADLHKAGWFGPQTPTPPPFEPRRSFAPRPQPQSKPRRRWLPWRTRKD